MELVYLSVRLAASTGQDSTIYPCQCGRTFERKDFLTRHRSFCDTSRVTTVMLNVWDLLTNYELAFEGYQFPDIRLSIQKITEL